MKILDKIKIRTKIFSSFGAVIALLLVISAVGAGGLLLVGQDFTKYQDNVRALNAAGGVDNSLLTMRIRAKDFIVKQDQKAAAAVMQSARETLAQLEDLELSLTSDAHLAIVAGAKAQVNAYIEAFGEVIKKQAEIDALKAEKLNKLGPEAVEKLTVIMEGAARDLETEIALATGFSLRAMLSEQLYAVKFLEDNSAAAAQAVAKYAAETDKHQKALAEMLSHHILLKTVKQVDEMHAGYGQAFAAAKAAVETRNDIISGKLDAVGPKVAMMVDGLRNDLRQQQRALDEKAVSESRLAIIGLVGVAFVSIVLASLAAWLIGGGIARSIGLITASMQRLSEGDRDVEIPHTENADEVGEMASALLVFKENLVETERLQAEQQAAEKRKLEDEARRAEEKRAAEAKAEEERRTADARAEEQRKRAMLEMADAFERSVKGVVDSLSTATDEMQSSAQNMLASAEETSKQATSVAAASEEATTNVQTVASATEELSASIAEISRQVNESNQISQTAVVEAKETNARVEGLAEAAQKIGEVVSLINDIASQTNLLALNATIEAARAGEAGKGFAVVASEVKSLATQTSKATEEIASQITAIQGATNDAVQAIQGIGSTIGQIGEIATSVASAVEQQGAATREIATNVQQAAGGTQDVSSNITQVTRAADESRDVSGQMLDAATQLARQGDVLRDEVEKFLQSVRAA